MIELRQLDRLIKATRRIRSVRDSIRLRRVISSLEERKIITKDNFSRINYYLHGMEMAAIKGIK